MTDVRRILVADDDEDIRDLVTFKLQSTAHEVRAVPDGVAAIEEIRSWKPDLAVLDVMMPGKSGLDVLREVRADEAVASTKVLLLTAKARDSEVDAGYGFGADDYVVKPFSPRELLTRIKSLLD